LTANVGTCLISPELIQVARLPDDVDTEAEQVKLQQRCEQVTPAMTTHHQ